MRFRVLGPLRVWDGACWAPVNAPQRRTVLAMLLTQAGQTVAVERIVDEIWGERPPPSATNTVQGHVVRLRKQLGAATLLTQGNGYELSVAQSDVDAMVFEDLVATARAARLNGRTRIAAGHLASALELWHGSAYADVTPIPTVSARASRLDGVRITVLEERFATALELGEHTAVVDELSRLVDEHPLREELWRLLMLALYRCGRQGEALGAYRRARRRFAAELGVDPGPLLQATERAILAEDTQQLAGMLGAAGSPATTGDDQVTVRPPAAQCTTPAQLPLDLPGFSGRDDELKQLDDAGLDREPGSVAVLTVTGMAGVGKSALAVRWARLVADRFPDGQLYVNLRGFDPAEPALNPAEAVGDFLTALGIPSQRIPPTLHARAALYRSIVTGRRMLIVLDNARDSDQARPLLPGSPGSLVVVTSRTDLSGLVITEGARPVVLDVLPEAEARQVLAVRLGPDRAAAEPAAVDNIITACGRLPLALAIVAARATTRPHFPLPSIVAELTERRSRLDALAAGEPGADVRAVFSWSYRTLSPAAARLFRLYGLHPGPDISTAAAASLTALTPARTQPVLDELCQANLLTEHRPGRYTCHDLLRAYATELAQAGEPDTQRHAAIERILDHYLHTAHTAARLLNPVPDPIPVEPAAPAPGTTPETIADAGQAMDWCTAEHAVLVAVVGQAVSTGLDTRCWQLAWCLTDHLDRQGHWHDHAAIGQSAVAAAGRSASPAMQGRAHLLLAVARGSLGRHDPSQTHVQIAIRLFDKAGDQAGQANAQHARGVLAESRGHYADALHHYRLALDLYRAVGHRRGQAMALNAIGWQHAELGEYQQAVATCQRALSLAQQVGDRHFQAMTWDSLGYAHHHLDHHGEAIACYRQAIQLCRDLDSWYNHAVVITHLAETQHATGDTDAARATWHQALTMLEQPAHPDAQPLRDMLTKLDQQKSASAG